MLEQVPWDTGHTRWFVSAFIPMLYDGTRHDELGMEKKKKKERKGTSWYSCLDDIYDDMLYVI